MANALGPPAPGEDTLFCADKLHTPREAQGTRIQPLLHFLPRNSFTSGPVRSKGLLQQPRRWLGQDCCGARARRQQTRPRPTSQVHICPHGESQPPARAQHSLLLQPWWEGFLMLLPSKRCSEVAGHRVDSQAGPWLLIPLGCTGIAHRSTAMTLGLCWVTKPFGCHMGISLFTE